MGCSDCVVPMEDAVQSLIDHLVYPLLPVKGFFSPEPPTLAQQESVAKQIHAVVILCNYYHRKQFPQLEFLDFKSFCKSASIAKPSLLAYMKFMHGPEDEPNNIEQLSITEKMVWNACNICTGLDESKDISAMGSWPVSRVAVLLVDSTKMNCFLQFSSITQGVWSLIEKDVDKSYDNQLNTSAMDVTDKKKNASGHLKDEILHHEDVFQQVAFSAVKEKAGISEEELTILEKHAVYSLSQQKAMAQFYLVQYIGAASDKITEFSLKDVVDSLQGPLLSEDLTVTPVVEYFHLLPYMDILSHWLSRQNSVDGLSLSLGQQRNLGENVQPGRTTVEHFKNNGKSFLTQGSEEVLGKKMSYDNSGIFNGKQDDLDCTIRQSRAASRPHNWCKDFPLKHQKKTQIKDETKAVENNAENTQVEKGEKISVNSGSRVHGDVYKAEVNLDGLVKKPCGIQCKGPRPSSRSDACSVVLSNRGGRGVTDLPLVPKPCHSQGSDGFQFIPMPFDPQNGDQFQSVMESKKRDLLEASLRVLQRKLEELHHQQRLLEDEIAQCEMNLQMVLSEEEDSLLLKFDSIIEACNSSCSNQVHLGKITSCVNQSQPRKIKRRKLCEAVLSLRTPCQELDGICCENNWTLPRYNILPSFEDGGYRASVAVQGPDFECKGDGDLCGTPQEARESAATHVLSKLRSMASQAPQP